VRRRDVQRNGTRAGNGRSDRPRQRAARLLVAALFAVATVGCGIVELEVEDEDPDGLDPAQELEDAPDDLVEDVRLLQARDDLLEVGSPSARRATAVTNAERLSPHATAWSSSSSRSSGVR
jgi:hypothetical protein